MLIVLAEAALRSFLLGAIVWAALAVFRVRNPHVQMFSWVTVLVASLSMPLVMDWVTLAVTRHTLPVHATAPMLLPEPLEPLQDLGEPLAEITAPAATAIRSHAALDWGVIDWGMIATAIYAMVAGFLLLRLVVGLGLTWRIAGNARPVDEPWLADWDVRMTPAIDGPVTFGSIILVPAEFDDWDFRKREAVVAHESAHVANRDFYLLLLASLNRAMFWFSPFAWWQLVRLAQLAEIISDAEAIEVLDDRLSYAEILLELVQNIGRAKPAGPQMARISTIGARIERIVAAVATPRKVDWRQRFWIAAAIMPFTVASSATIAYRTEPQTVLVPDDAVVAPPSERKPFVNFYAVGGRRVFAIFHDGEELFGQLTGQPKLRLTVSRGIATYAAASGSLSFAIDTERQSSRLTLQLNAQTLQADRLLELPRPQLSTDATSLDHFVGWYRVADNRVLAVTSEGTALTLKETGRPAFTAVPDGMDAFSDPNGGVFVFAGDKEGRANHVLAFDPGSGARLGGRISKARAKMLEEEFARRVAEIPDRFRDQVPTPGAKEAILRGIADLRQGAPNYDRMSAGLAAKIRAQTDQLHAMFVALGPVEQIFFRGVGPGGYDIYGAKFANGFAEFRLLLGADGKAEDVLFRPNGNDTPGGTAPCATEASLKAHADNTPIRLSLYNDSGDDIQLYDVDATGQRAAKGAVGDNMTSQVLTTVGTPWIVTDRAGRCLEIVLPGQRTRYHTIEAPSADGTAHAQAPRTTPQAGSEDMLRRYIEALGRGEPDYDHMTAEVAAQTRQSLAVEQAIVARLGTLRALSFRTVSQLGNDVYTAHFANGSADWRISLTKDGSIAHIALGPSF
jgi:beta-lactamase regulating signal transducer with metallopeptidase domain